MWNSKLFKSVDWQAAAGYTAGNVTCRVRYMTDLQELRTFLICWVSTLPLRPFIFILNDEHRDQQDYQPQDAWLIKRLGRSPVEPGVAWKVQSCSVQIDEQSTFGHARALLHVERQFERNWQWKLHSLLSSARDRHTATSLSGCQRRRSTDVASKWARFDYFT